MREPCPALPASAVIEAAMRLVERDIGEVGLRRTVRELLRGFEHRSGTPPLIPPLARIPAFAYGGVTGEYGPALPLCGLSLLLYLGVDILDDLMDGDVTPYWIGQSAAETLLIGATLVSAVPNAAVARLDAPVETIAGMHRALAAGLLRMAGGQQLDIAAAGREAVPPADVEHSVAGKSGALTAMLASLGARFAGADEPAVAAYHAWGEAYGTAEQVRADCAELFADVPCMELAQGKLTYPLACLAAATEPADLGLLHELLVASADGAAPRAALRSLLIESGAAAETAVLIEWQCAAAAIALDAARPLPPARDELLEMLARTGVRSPLFSNFSDKSAQDSRRT